jgi:dTDP-4-dehydrorhamnose 3,5-epimerase-like enzyme
MYPQATVERLVPFRDARGFVVEPLALVELAKQRNVHVVWTACGALRGNHRHLKGTEVTLVIGPSLVHYKDTGGVQEVLVPKGELYRFTFPPEVAHAFGALGPEPMVLVCFNTMLHDSENPDTISDQILTVEELVGLNKGIT